ncbi:MAG: Gfo/Idh/MocA family oxidoreductase [Myxococcota bacterium]|nr:Gfo/Idh/MocA family oxidoreductase [Myxococcota bacterium]
MASSSAPFGIGLIGAGGISTLHSQAFRALPDLARVVAVADLDAERAESLRDRFGYEAALTDHREMLAREDVDVAVVCTRPNLHARLVKDALDAGKHVLCEKPLAHTLPDCDAIIEAAEPLAAEQKVSAVYQWRHDRAYQRLAAVVGRGDLGRLIMGSVHVRTNRSPKHYEAARESWELDGGGALMVMGIHQLDLLISLFGDPVECSARRATFLKPTEAEDSIAGWVRFASGALVTVTCSVCEHESNFELHVVGDRGAGRLIGARRGRPPAPQTCRLELTSNRRGDRMALATEPLADLPKQWAEGTLRYRVEQLAARLRRRGWQPPASWWHGPMAEAFLTAIRDGLPAPVPPREARRSVELAAGLYHSSETGETVQLPIGPGHAGYSHLPEVETPVRAVS